MAKRTYASYGKRDAKGRLLPKGRRSNPKKRKRRRKRRSNPVVSSGGGGRRRRRSRRSNPVSYRRAVSRGGNLFWAGVQWQDIVGGVAGRLLMARMTRWLGSPYGKSLFGLQNDLTSPFAGKAWNGWNYALGLGSVWMVAKMVQRWRPRLARNMWRGALEDAAVRMLWTEGIGRWPTGQQWFGNPYGPSYDNNYMMGAEDVYGPGVVTDTSDGQRFIQLPNGQQVAMMGYQMRAYSDSLAPASPMDDSLTTASPMDDALVRSTPMDRRPRNRQSFEDPYETSGMY